MRRAPAAHLSRIFRLQHPTAIAYALLTLGATASCGTLNTNTAAEQSQVRLMAQDPIVAHQALHGATLELPWNVQNGTSSKLTLAHATWTTTLEPSTVAGCESAEQPTATPNNTPLNLQIEPQKNTAGRLRVTLDQSTWASSQEPTLPCVHAYSVHAVFHIETNGKTREHQAQWHGELLAPQQPRVTLQVEGSRYDTQAVEMSFQIGIDNRNPFTVPLDGLTYSLFVEDTEVSKGELAASQVLKAGGELIFDVHRLIGRDELRELGARLSHKKALRYRLESTLAVENGPRIAQPIEGVLDFAR